MNSVALILAAVLFLAPGLGFYAGFFILGGSSQFKVAPPRPSSLLSLTIIVFASITSHAVAAFLFRISEVDVGWFEWTTFEHSPNPYEVAMSLATDPNSMTGDELRPVDNHRAAMRVAARYQLAA